MALKKIEKVKGRGVPLPGDDVDTDQIIPARFMKCVTFDGLGEYAFYDLRFDESNNHKAHPLNEPQFKEANILIAGSNFGCGSSREHAPQALYHFGIEGIIAESFAEIFFGNCTTLGIPCITLNKQELRDLSELVAFDPNCEIEIDLVSLEVKYANKSIQCKLPEGIRRSLVEGRWDALAELLEGKPETEETYKKLPYLHLQ